MGFPQSPDEHLKNLRQWRNRTEADLSMHFLQDDFKKEIQKPYKQLCQMTEVWTALVPADLLQRTRLESLSRGVLRVIVDSSSSLYELDRLLRQGLEREIITQHKGPAVRKIQLRVGQVARAENR